MRAELKEQADLEAIRVFASNLRELLMAPPLGGRPVLAIDPGYRTGCKVVVLDATGRLLDHGVVYPTPPREDISGTKKALDRWSDRFPDIAAIAIGTGTGGRKRSAGARVSRHELPGGACEAARGKRHGTAPSADVLRPSERIRSLGLLRFETAREELLDQDVTVRGAVSIGRRLQDPLAELVKIDPKAIGVGQYQHDVDQKLPQAARRVS
jgi:uncharacterized protein